MKKFLSILLTLLVTAQLAACTVAGGNSSTETAESSQQSVSSSAEISSQPAEASGGVVRVALKADTPTVDPQGKTPTTDTAGILNHIFEGLVRVRGNEILPGIAETWDISDDGLVYTFHLRDANWSDGQPVTADDFVYGMQRLVNPETATNNAAQGFYILNGRAVNAGEKPVEELGVKALDEKTLEVTLENPTAYFLSLCGQYFYMPVREDIHQQYGTEFASSAETNVYNGPFMLKEWRVEEKLVLERNPSYWDAEAVKLDTIEYQIVNNVDTGAAMFDADQVDFVPEINPEMLSLYEGQTIEYDTGKLSYIRFNMDGSNEITANKNFRKAFAAAFDRTEFCQLYMNGIYPPNGRFTSQSIAGADGAYTEEHPYDFPVTADIETAKEYLDQALGELGLSAPSDITLEIMTRDSESDRKVGTIVQDMMLKNLGINITVRSIPATEWLEEHKNHTYELSYNGNGPDYNDPFTYLELYVSDFSGNHSSYNNPEYDRLITEANAETDPQKRMGLLFDAEMLLVEDVVGVPTVTTYAYALCKPNLKDVQLGFQSPSPDFVYAYYE